MLWIILICGVLTATVTMKTYGILTQIGLLVFKMNNFVLTGMKLTTELNVHVLIICIENTTVLKKMNTSVLIWLFVIFGELMRTVNVLKVLMLVKMNGVHYVYILLLKKHVNVVEILLANMITLVISPVSVIKILIISFVIQVLQIVCM